MDDTLLNSFFDGVGYYGNTGRSHLESSGRDTDGINRRKWALIVRYEGHTENAVDYKPGPARKNREGAPWTKEDWYVLRLAFSSKKAVEYGADNPIHLARVTSRSTEEVHTMLTKCEGSCQGFAIRCKSEQDRRANILSGVKRLRRC
jgi:hypothetical protein